MSMSRRVGAPETAILAVQCNLANTYQNLGRFEEALRLKRDVYSGYLKLHGEEHERTFTVANNYANCLLELQRFEEAKTLLREVIPVARRVLGEGCDATLKMSWYYAAALSNDGDATRDDLREAVTTLEETERTARRVFGGAHPLTVGIGEALRAVRATLGRRETPGSA